MNYKVVFCYWDVRAITSYIHLMPNFSRLKREVQAGIKKDLNRELRKMNNVELVHSNTNTGRAN